MALPITIFYIAVVRLVRVYIVSTWTQDLGVSLPQYVAITYRSNNVQLNLVES